MGGLATLDLWNVSDDTELQDVSGDFDLRCFLGDLFRFFRGFRRVCKEMLRSSGVSSGSGKTERNVELNKAIGKERMMAFIEGFGEIGILVVQNSEWSMCRIFEFSRLLYLVK